MGQAAAVNSATRDAISRAFDFAEACTAAGIHDPAEIPHLVAYAKAAEKREESLARYRRAKAAHVAFSASHDDDDPAHEDHQRRLGQARTVLTATEQLLDEASVTWRKARGL